MGNINFWQGAVLVFLGMSISHLYNWIAWRKYYEGRNERRKQG